MQEQRNHDLLNAIPMLRRYAFCLTGSREAGDGWIERTLQEFIAGRVPLNGSSVTVSLFKAFTRTCSVAGTFSRLRLDSDCDERELLAKVLQLPMEQRRALLLVSTMRFTEAETAEILDLSAEEVRRLRIDASRSMARSPPLQEQEARVGYPMAEPQQIG